jgi:hypothetical protein
MKLTDQGQASISLSNSMRQNTIVGDINETWFQENAPR